MKLTYKVGAVKIGCYNKDNEKLEQFEISDVAVDVELEVKELPELVSSMAKFVVAKATVAPVNTNKK